MRAVKRHIPVSYNTNEKGLLKEKVTRPERARADSIMNFEEYTQGMSSGWKDALKIFANVLDPLEVKKTFQEWEVLINQLANKRTNLK